VILFRRSIQLASLALFLVLLSAAVSSSLSFLSLDFFLRLDPVLAAVTAISARIFITAFIPAAIVILITPLLGRVFCGYICPMGTTIDGTDKLLSASPSNFTRSASLQPLKYLILAFFIGAALLGVSFVFAASPLSLITRFYGLLIQPVLALLADGVLRLVQPLAEGLDLNSVKFIQIDTPRFTTQYFILFFFMAVFALARFSPRFWCRYMCPSGALLALFAGKPLIRRTVSQDCTDCGLCVRSCPMKAIADQDPAVTSHRECIVCRTCEDVCPVDAVSFSLAGRKDFPAPEFSPSRRRFMAAGLAGAGTAAVGLTGLAAFNGRSAEGRVLPEGLLRPPGALPEAEFLARCVRCGECMAACPTNMLQPIWFETGLLGLFSPAAIPRRGYCDPECNLCGNICPTGAIRELPLEERIWARPGLAVIEPSRCLAWEQQKSCMVCDEVCPFGSVEFKYEPGNPVPVPRVIEDKCAGCGACEYHCPVQNRAAITVKPTGALRLADGSYREHGQRQGLTISRRLVTGSDQTLKEEGGQAPGFDEEEDSAPAPGFSD